MIEGTGLNSGSTAPQPQFEMPEVPLTPEAPQEPKEENSQEAIELEKDMMKVNLAEKMKEEKLNEISMECKRGYDADYQSMQDWLGENEEWSKLARQVREEKTFPWPGASNVKYPLISTAALQFSARAYPTLVPADGKLVKTRMWGKDPSGEKRKKGERIGTYMSWQFAEQLEYWEEDMDKLLIMTPVLGQAYKKTFYDPATERVESQLVYPENFIIDYWTKSIETSKRYSEIHPMYKMDIDELVRRDFFKDVDLGPPSGDNPHPSKEVPEQKRDATDYTNPYYIIEQHAWIDTNGDDIREPVIVWFEYTSGKILRIQVRYSPDDIKMQDNKVVGYKPHTHYTKFGFIPNPDGSFFDMGFGHLLGPINEAVNTNINQLIDSGTLSNLNAGFIAKGLRIKMADQSWKPGEWKSVNGTFDDLRKGIVPLPSKEPSNVLFQLLGMLITSGKELASVAEIFVGKMPGQNTPATTTMATIEQGMKVFTAIYKRVYRSLASEYKKVFYLNKYYLDPATYERVLDEPIYPEDFDDSTYDVCPTADPTATTQAEKILKAQALWEMLGAGMLDPMKVQIRMLEAQEIPNWQELIPGMAETGQPAPPQEKQDPKLQAQMEKAKTDMQLAERKAQMDEKKAQQEMAMKNADMQFKQAEHQMDLAHKQQMTQLETQSKAQMNQIFMAEAQTKAITAAAEGQQKLQQNDAAHKQKLQQTKEQQKSKSSTQSNNVKNAKRKNR